METNNVDDQGDVNNVKVDVSNGPEFDDKSTLEVPDSQAPVTGMGGPVWKSGKSIPDLMTEILEREDTLKDVVFIVGNEKITAHKLILAMSSPVFYNLFYHHTELRKHVGKVIVPLPKKIQPKAFRLLLRYVYCRTWEHKTEDALELLRVANYFKFDELACSCRTQLRLNPQNAAEYLERGNEFDKRLKEIALKMIIDKTPEVFGTDEFLKLSRESLAEILKSDNLKSREIEIFHATMRWAEYNVRAQLENPDVKISGEVLRQELGNCVFLIRYPVMTQLEFVINVVPRAILLPQELNSVFMSQALLNSNNEDNTSSLLSQSFQQNEQVVPLALFSTKERVPRDRQRQPRVNSPPAEPTEVEPSQSQGTRKSCRISQIEARKANMSADDTDEPPSKIIRIQDSIIDSSNASDPDAQDGAANIIEDSSDSPSTSASFCKRRQESGSAEDADVINHSPFNSAVSLNEMDDDNASRISASESLQSGGSYLETKNVGQAGLLTQEQQEYIKENRNPVFSESVNLSNIFQKYRAMSELDSETLLNITHIHETDPVVINKLAWTHSLNFPALEVFHVDYLLDVKSPGALRLYFEKFDICELFFVLDPNDFHHLWASRLKITITVNGITVLKTDFDEKTIVMRQLDKKHVESILAGLSGSDIKKVIIESCHLGHFLDAIPTEHLNTLVLLKTRHLRSYEDFLAECVNLETFCCNDFMNGPLNLEHLGFLDECSKLKKLALAKANLSCPTPSRKLKNPLEELYLDLCKLDNNVVAAIPQIFSNLKKVKVYKTVTWTMLWKFLQIPSLEWIAVWEIPSCKIPRSKSKQNINQYQDLLALKTFLADAGIVLKDNSTHGTFVLTKTLAEGPLQNDTSSDSTTAELQQNAETKRFDNIMNENEYGLWVWTAMKIPATGRERWDRFNKWDFEHFEQGFVYPDAEYYVKMN